MNDNNLFDLDVQVVSVAQEAELAPTISFQTETPSCWCQDM